MTYEIEDTRERKRLAPNREDRNSKLSSFNFKTPMHSKEIEEQLNALQAMTDNLKAISMQHLPPKMPPVSQQKLGNLP